MITIGSNESPPDAVADHNIIKGLGSFRGSKKSPGVVKPEVKIPEQHDNPNGDDDEKTEDPGEHEEKSKDADGKSDNEVKGENAEDSLLGDLNPIVLDKKGTGPTTVGYVKDFIDERANPAYKTMGSPATDPSPEIAKMVNEKSVLPCYDEKSESMNPRCSDHDTALIAYNSEPFLRTWCGKEIKPKSAVVMAEHCDDPVAHLFSSEVPPITGEHMPPIIIKTSEKKVAQELDLEQVECDVPCEQEKGLHFGADESSGRQYFIEGEEWKIKMDGKKMDRTDYSNNQYYSSQSLVSSIPLSNFDPKIHSLRNQPKLDFETAEKKAIYLVNSNCKGRSTKRNYWFDVIKDKGVTVDSFGKCGHNTDVPEGMTIDSPEGRIALSKRYRVVLALDDASSKDQISNVVWEAFASGAVPVVLGAENIAERFPPKSFINTASFDDKDELAAHVKKVLSDKTEWLSYQTWRDDEKAIEAVERQNSFSGTGPTCRLCRWAYAKKYGLGWDHTRQEVRSITKVPKDKLCATIDHGLVSKPFSEMWVTKGDDERVLEEDSDGESCSSLITDGSISVGSFKGHRKVFHHDGVTDFFITESIDETADAETSLRLKFPGVRNPDGACFYNTHSLVSTAKGAKVSSASIQDDLVKITILANWDTTVKCTGEGIMEVVVKKDSQSITQNDAPRSVRVIIEEVNPIVDKMTEFLPSSYCKLMTKDFIDPIGVFLIDS